MAVTIKTLEEQEKMRVAGHLAAQVLEMIGPKIQRGITTDELNAICHEHIVHLQHAIPAPLNYNGFPKSICTSVNHVVCHGIPNDRPLREGDIVNVDITVIKDGYHGDTSKMFYVGKPSIQAERLCRITQECLYKGMEIVKPGVLMGKIGEVIQAHAESNGYSVVQEYCGHGIGRIFHEDPQVLHYKSHDRWAKLEIQEGMCFTIEPMINAGKRHVSLMRDQWTVVTKDRSLSAQWEHTILVTRDGIEVLTKRNEESF